MALSKVPRGATVHTDCDGEYVIYNKACAFNGCGVALTSRNRGPAGVLMCKTCANTKARGAAGTRPDRTGKHPGGPERQAVHKLLTSFLAQPTIMAYKDALLSALVDYELKERFRCL